MLVLAIAPVVSGLLIGYARGGRLRNVAGMRVRAIWLPWLMAAAQLSCSGRPRLALVFGLGGLWVLLNLLRRRRIVQAALLLILLGGAMNAAAIVVNGAMPYTSAEPSAVAHTAGAKHTRLDSGTKLPWLADVIPFPPLRARLSAGDLVLFAGIGLFVATAMTPMRRPAKLARIPQGDDGYPVGTIDTSQSLHKENVS